MSPIGSHTRRAGLQTSGDICRKIMREELAVREERCDSYRPQVFEDVVQYYMNKRKASNSSW